MNAALRKFLDTRDLDELQAARQQISVMSRADRAALDSILSDWSRPQAVANLLMQPDVMPPGQRLPLLLKALEGGGYWALAAVVGLQHLAADDLPDEARPVVAARLLALLRRSIGVVAQRASVTLAGFAADLTLADQIPALSHPDPLVRHNLLANLLLIAEPQEIRAALSAAVASGALDSAAQDSVLADLRQIGFIGRPDPPAAEVLHGNLLAAPSLTYIPNYDEWQAQLP